MAKTCSLPTETMTLRRRRSSSSRKRRIAAGAGGVGGGGINKIHNNGGGGGGGGGGSIIIPTVDMGKERESSSSSCHDEIVKACEEYGFFKVVNHGVPLHIISTLEKEALHFFAKPSAPINSTTTTPSGPGSGSGSGSGSDSGSGSGSGGNYYYGSKNIGLNGDMGELEYLLLQAPLIHSSSNINPPPHHTSLPNSSISSTTHHYSTNFRCAVDEYIGAVRELACEILDMAEQHILHHHQHNNNNQWAHKSASPVRIMSSLLKDVHSDSCFRLNHYLPLLIDNNNNINPLVNDTAPIGFGEHSDPQILTILRSNDVGGLQICSHDGLWIPVPPDPDHFFVFVGDALQAMTNERFVSVRHRVVANSANPRMSMMYFGAPPLDTWISPLPYMVSSQNPSLYKPFTWEQYKKAAYSMRLGDRRLELFKHNHSTTTAAAVDTTN